MDMLAELLPSMASAKASSEGYWEGLVEFPHREIGDLGVLLELVNIFIVKADLLGNSWSWRSKDPVRAIIASSAALSTRRESASGEGAAGSERWSRGGISAAQ